MTSDALLVTSAKAKRPLKRNDRLLYRGDVLGLSVNSTTFGRAEAVVKLLKLVVSLTLLMYVEGSAAVNASAMPLAVRAPAMLHA